MAKKIWIVDDDTITRFLIRKSLSKAPVPIETEEFSNGRTALEGLTSCVDEGKDLPDMVLVDLNMPIMDGWDFLRELKSKGIKAMENIKFVILTSSIDPRDEEKGNADPLVVAFLRKPLNLQSLLTLLNVSEGSV